MKNQIETLDEAIQEGVEITATYLPNGEVVKCDFNAHSGTSVTCEFQDGSIEEVSKQDLIDFIW